MKREKQIELATKFIDCKLDLEKCRAEYSARKRYGKTKKQKRAAWLESLTEQFRLLDIRDDAKKVFLQSL